MIRFAMLLLIVPWLLLFTGCAADSMGFMKDSGRKATCRTHRRNASASRSRPITWSMNG